MDNDETQVQLEPAETEALSSEGHGEEEGAEESDRTDDELTEPVDLHDDQVEYMLQRCGSPPPPQPEDKKPPKPKEAEPAEAMEATAMNQREEGKAKAEAIATMLEEDEAKAIQPLLEEGKAKAVAPTLQEDKAKAIEPLLEEGKAKAITPTFQEDVGLEEDTKPAEHKTVMPRPTQAKPSSRKPKLQEPCLPKPADKAIAVPKPSMAKRPMAAASSWEAVKKAAPNALASEELSMPAEMEISDSGDEATKPSKQAGRDQC